MSDYHGHMTMVDGTHVALTKDEAEALWRHFEEADAKDAADMPDAEAALAVICRARQRLRKLGWAEGIYCPKDGTEFAVAQIGSTGMWRGWFDGDAFNWTDGWISLADFRSRPQEMFWKALDKLTPEERAHMAKCEEDERIATDRQIASWAAEDAAAAQK
jgi:hypothetical protein